MPVIIAVEQCAHGGINLIVIAKEPRQLLN